MGPIHVTIYKNNSFLEEVKPYARYLYRSYFGVSSCIRSIIDLNAYTFKIIINVSLQDAYISMDSLSVLYEYALAHNCVTYTEYIPLLGTPKITFPLKEACLCGEYPYCFYFLYRNMSEKRCALI